MSIYAFRPAPSYGGADRSQQFLAALDQPMGPWQTFWDQAKGGVLESFGLGTVIRDMSIPQGAEPRPSPMAPIANAPLVGPVFDQGYRALRETINPVDTGEPAMSQDDYKASPYFRDNVPWDEGMTEDRAASLAAWNDARAVREFFGQKRPITSFMGNLAGQAVDPINYIPVAGPSVRAASAARFGTVAGTAAVASVDAAANTALFGAMTRDARGSFGDDVSWQMMTTEIAMGAVIGAAFGGAVGVFARRQQGRAAREAARSLETLENVQQSRVALNEAIDGLANEGQVRLSPNGGAAVSGVARGQLEIAPQVRDRILASQEGLVQDIETLRSAPAPEPEQGSVRLYAVGESPQDAFVPGRITEDADTARAFRAQNPGARLYSIDAPADRQDLVAVARGEEADIAPERAQDVQSEIAAGARLVPDEAPVLTPEQRDLARVMDRWGIDYRATEPGQAAQQMRDMALNLRQRSTPNLSEGQAEPRPDGIAEASTRVGTPERPDQAAEAYRVNRETGDYVEAGEIEQLRAEGRLNDDDIASLNEQQEMFDQSLAYGRALEAAVTCLI